MEHTKKMVLVSPDVLNRVNTSQPAQISQTKVRELEGTLSQLLDDSHLDDASKMKRYADVLQRLMVYDNKTKLPSTVRVLPDPSPVLSEENKSTIQKEEIVNEIVDSVPKAMKRKAAQLVRKIRSSNGALSWNGVGELVVKDQAVKGSHIVDLINDAVRRRKSGRPTGVEEFTKGLAKLNTPRELIGNPDRWEDIMKWINATDADTPQSKRQRCSRNELYGTAYHLPPTKKQKRTTRSRSGRTSMRWEKY
ncbi:hypothetical protein HOLleu_01287 [Holothuria leucospilota]|uniref:Uncharacterized protein n=1 Tax=Holothuria leucospilota TaxID=206669 RepID=A0A9Q1CPR1_HOLLE|nr:hypothetical protein HOLleu_01287 [Holothuria leucospilota]